MFQFKIKEIEEKLGKKIKRNIVSLGIDTANKSGWAIIRVDNEYMTLNLGFINVNVKDIYLKFDTIIENFNNLISKEYDVVIEDTYFARNPKTFRQLSRIGAVAYTISHLKKCKSKRYINASSARKTVGVHIKKNGIKTKIQVQTFIQEKFGITLENEDIADSVILAIVGVLE